MTRISQPPAKYAAFLARLALVRMTAVVLVWIGLALFAVHAPPFKAHRTLLVALALVALLGAVVFSRARTSRARALIGVRSERRVATVLAALRPVGLLNGALLGAGGDADHIVVGPWLAVVETKTGHGATSYDGNQMRAGSRIIPGNPVTQVQRQAAALHHIAGEFVDAIVCVVDMANPPFFAGTTAVCSLADLPAVLRSKESRLDPTRAGRIYDNLTTLKMTAAPARNAQE